MNIIDEIKNNIAGGKEEPVEIGIDDITIMIRITESESYTSEVATTLLEDGSNASDHVIINPVTINITGDVSDIFRSASTFAQITDEIQSQIGAVDGYIPAKTQQQLSKISAIANDLNDVNRAIENAYNKGSNILNSFKNNSNAADGNQKKFYDEIVAKQRAGQRVKIKMPFKTHENMIITNIDFGWDNEFDSTGFSLSAQQIRFATSAVTRIDTQIINPSEGTGGSVEGEVNKSTNNTESSALKSFVGDTDVAVKYISDTAQSIKDIFKR